MLTRIRIRNFKQFDDVEIELGPIVAFVGPNNSGKTTVLQALALWYAGFKVWQRVMFEFMDEPDDISHWPMSDALDQQPTINRYDLTAIPAPHTNLLWRDLITGNGADVPVEITAHVLHHDGVWIQGYRFWYANPESLYCVETEDTTQEIYTEGDITVAFLPPMSGLVPVEPFHQAGRIDVLIGEGRTAEVLRNLCYVVYQQTNHWQALVDHMQRLFGVDILPPDYAASRGEIRMMYRTPDQILLDISAAGRGMLQVLLLLAYLYSHPRTTLLLDEPDAHLEVLRQREIYQLLTQIAHEQQSQLVIATHSEVILNEIGDRDMLISFVGKPHRIDERGNQFRSRKQKIAAALKEVGFDQYYQAEQTRWVLYLEGATNLAILRAFAEILDYTEAQRALERPFVHYVSNQPGAVSKHLYNLREAVPHLNGVAIFDNLQRELRNDLGDQSAMLMWQRNEIENYLCYPDVLEAYAADGVYDFDVPQRKQLMHDLIADLVPPVALRERDNRWWTTVKASDDFLDPLFETYFERLELPNMMRKTDYYVLAQYLTPGQIVPEIREKLDAIVTVASHAKQLGDDNDR